MSPDKFPIIYSRHGDHTAILVGEISNYIQLSAIFSCVRLCRWLQPLERDCDKISFCTTHLGPVRRIQWRYNLRTRYHSSALVFSIRNYSRQLSCTVMRNLKGFRSRNNNFLSPSLGKSIDCTWLAFRIGQWECRRKSDRVHAPTAVVTDRVERMRRSPTTEYNLKFHRLKSQCDLCGESIWWGTYGSDKW